MTTAHWTSKEVQIVVPPRRQSVSVSWMDNEATLTDNHEGNIYQLNQTAATIWQRCNGKRTITQIAKYLTKTYDVDLEIALDHVEQVVTQLAESDLLEMSKKA